MRRHFFDCFDDSIKGVQRHCGGPDTMKWAFFFVVSLFAATTVAAGASQSFQIDSKASRVTFSSKAPFETVIGTTQEVSGTVLLQPAHVMATRADIFVTAASLNTQNRMRDKDMRNKFLEVDRYPKIRFTLDRVITGPKQWSANRPETFEVEGTFEIHGVKQKETISLQATYDAVKQTVMIEGNFPIHLTDYQIDRPQFLWMRLADVAQVSIQLSLRESK